MMDKQIIIFTDNKMHKAKDNVKHLRESAGTGCIDIVSEGGGGEMYVSLKQEEAYKKETRPAQTKQTPRISSFAPAIVAYHSSGSIACLWSNCHSAETSLVFFLVQIFSKLD